MGHRRSNQDSSRSALSHDGVSNIWDTFRWRLRLMTNPTLIPFKVEHLLALQGAWHEEFWILIQKEKHPSFTAVVDDQILGCGGVIVSAPGVGVAWACFSELIN